LLKITDLVCLESPPHNKDWYLVKNNNHSLAEELIRNTISVHQWRPHFSEYFLQGVDPNEIPRRWQSLLSDGHCSSLLEDVKLDAQVISRDTGWSAVRITTKMI